VGPTSRNPIKVTKSERPFNHESNHTNFTKPQPQLDLQIIKSYLQIPKFKSPIYTSKTCKIVGLFYDNSILWSRKDHSVLNSKFPVISLSNNASPAFGNVKNDKILDSSVFNILSRSFAHATPFPHLRSRIYGQSSISAENHLSLPQLL